MPVQVAPVSVPVAPPRVSRTGKSPVIRSTDRPIVTLTSIFGVMVSSTWPVDTEPPMGPM